MKTTTIKTSITAAFAAGALISSAQASTILVDYDDGIVGDGHDSSVKGGDFNSENDGGWVYNLGANNATFSVDKSSGVGSDGNLVIGAANSAPTGPKIPGVDTGATIATGDTFDLSFMWRESLVDWDDGADTVSLSLFFTDTNLIDGTATDVLTLTSGFSASNDTYQTESLSGQGYNGSEIAGKKLFARINTSAMDGEFARLDNVYIEVTTVPEPSSIVLLGLGGLALILRRRK
ncbi:MAG: hypothetical protein ACI9FG_001510 [Crocinitomicaceae bacterium]|jgi:hypothetical protein